MANMDEPGVERGALATNSVPGLFRSLRVCDEGAPAGPGQSAPQATRVVRDLPYPPVDCSLAALDQHRNVYERDILVNGPTDSSHDEPTAPDAVGRGVLGHDPEGQSTLFVLAGHSLGSTPVGGAGSPRWLDLRRLLNLDAVGEPSGSKIPVEATFDGGPTLEALWPEPFCDQVTDRLRELLEAGQMIPEGAPGEPEMAPAPAPSTGNEPSRVEPAPFSSPSGGPDSKVWATPDERPLPGDGPPLARTTGATGSGELTLEDVVYHGGYPGQTKRRKKCVAVLDDSSLRVSGPNGPDFTLAWDTVRSVEAQNADEAKFRLGVKVRRNSSVIVFECDQGVSIVLEAHDVPTMPLKSALKELLDEGPVTVA